MNRIILNKVVIEVTRRCNMSCPHCLRGDAQNIDIDLEILDKFLSNFKDCYIREVFFTGGEPTLNIEAVKRAVELVWKYNIKVQVFSIISNGKGISNRAIGIMNKVPNFTLCLSQDEYHDVLTEKDYAQLRKLKEGTIATRIVDANNMNLLAIGRARDNHIGICIKDYKGLIFSSYKNNLVIVSPIVCTCLGDVLNDCDYSFHDSDMICALKFCEYDDDIISMLKEEANNNYMYNLAEIPDKGSKMYKFFEFLRNSGIKI